MNQWDRAKKFYKDKYNLDLQDEDKPEYDRIVKKMNKKVGPQTIFILFGVVILLYIVFGILVGQLLLDQYTLVPFIIVVIIILGNANGIPKIAAKFERELVDNINRKRNMSQPPLQQFIQQPLQQPAQLSPKQAPRQHQIPPELVKIMQNPQAPQSGTLTFSTMSSTQSEQNLTGVSNQTSTVPPVKKPTLAANCPACGQLIPSESNPCPKCGAQLYWD